MKRRKPKKPVAIARKPEPSGHVNDAVRDRWEPNRSVTQGQK